MLTDLDPFVAPAFTGLRVMMMPVIWDDPDTIPDLNGWHDLLATTARRLGWSGVGYVTIDEAHVTRGEHHRRPGLHVDGGGTWGGGNPWGGSRDHGFVVGATVSACRAFPSVKPDVIGPDGEVEAPRPSDGVPLLAHRLYHLDPLCPHKTLPMPATGPRQFVRLSSHTTAPWFEGYTPNPLGVAPAGPILPARTAQMAHRT